MSAFYHPKPLPTEIRSVVEHEDGWKYIRIGVDRWLGWDDLSNLVEDSILTDEYVSKERWTQIYSDPETI